ncbi:MAG: hypothetical protein HYU64_08650 [Armatimonadetes bacterium]|nr:hypothetical protein [Armatimonadota bacterium]
MSTIGYMGSDINRVGDRVESRKSYLMMGRTAEGDSVIRLDSDRDYRVSEEDPALVIRTEQDGEWKWKPVTGAEELKQFLEKATLQEKRENLGLWKDARKWVIFGGKDGIPQDGEVRPISERWDTQTFSYDETARDTHDRTCAWARNYSRILGGEVLVNLVQSATGTLAVLEEPQAITRTEVEYVTLWGICGAGELPQMTEEKVYQEPDRV